MTGFISDWKHFFMLRCAPGAHPQAQEIAIPLEQTFKKLGLL
jgi:thymidylate synthase ThyX